jgi:hypothetical protein
VIGVFGEAGGGRGWGGVQIAVVVAWRPGKCPANCGLRPVLMLIPEPSISS